MFARFGERNRHSLASGAPGTTDSMHVRLRRRRYVVVHDVRHVLHVETARGDVGRDEKIRLVGAEFLHDPVALLLRQPAVQGLGAIAAGVERLGQFVDFGARAAEDDGRVGVFDIEHPA